MGHAVSAYQQSLDAAAALTGISVSYAPSARVLAAVRRHAQLAAPVRALAVADPADTGYPPLTGARLEADTVAAVFPGSEPPLTGAAATRAAVKDRVRSPGLVHIASHGFAALSSPLDSGLIMAGGEVLTARDLTAERLTARLVVLSACESGLPGAALPDEVVGLPTSLLYAGAAGVLATMWQVPDDDTTIFTVGFYDAWRRRGLAPAAACAAACAWLRTTTDGAKLEYFAELMSAGRAGSRQRWPSVAGSVSYSTTRRSGLMVIRTCGGPSRTAAPRISDLQL
jgi:CHAT domain-containing protein